MKKYSSNTILRNAKVFEQLAVDHVQKFKKIAAAYIEPELGEGETQEERDRVIRVANYRAKLNDLSLEELREIAGKNVNNDREEAARQLIKEKEAAQARVDRTSEFATQESQGYAAGASFAKNKDLDQLRNERNSKQISLDISPDESDPRYGYFKGYVAALNTAISNLEKASSPPSPGGSVAGGRATAPASGTASRPAASRPAASKPAAPTGTVYAKNAEADKLVAESKQYLKTLIENFVNSPGSYPTDQATRDMQGNIAYMYGEINKMNPLSYNDIGGGLNTVAAYVGGLANLLVAQGTQFQNTIVSLSAYTTYLNNTGLELQRIAESQPAPAQPAAGKPAAGTTTDKTEIKKIQKLINNYFKLPGAPATKFTKPLVVDGVIGTQTRAAMTQMKEIAGNANMSDDELIQRLKDTPQIQ